MRKTKSFIIGLTGYGLLFLILKILVFVFGVKIVGTNYLITSITSGFYEEITKLILVKPVKKISSIFFGLGWGVSEAILSVIYRGNLSIFALLFHIVNAVVLCYFIQKNMLLAGLTIAITSHILYNLFIAPNIISFLLGILS